MEFIKQYALSNITSFHIGGPADYFCIVRNSDELNQALEFAQSQKIPILVLGGGSNVLVSDQGFQGLVIQNQIKRLDIADSGEVYVGGGELWDNVVAQVINRGLAGIECLSGVPGTAGGGVVQNIGAYGQTLSDVIEWVDGVEIQSGQAKKFSASECTFEYRTSWFKQNPNQYIVTGFGMKLKPNGRPSISYPHVAKHFEKNLNPSLGQVREFVIRLRSSKGYLLLPGYESYNTAGSYFKNPIVNQEQFQKLESMLGTAELNRFWATPKGYKIAAAFLMQEAGFGKGYREGNVGISPKHSLSLVNFGGGTAVEVKMLSDKIKKTVWEKYSVALEEEVILVGQF